MITRLNINIEGTDYGIESVFNQAKKVTQFDIYENGNKKFSIEPTVIYGHGKEISWDLAAECGDARVENEIIDYIGSVIENNTG